MLPFYVDCFPNKGANYAHTTLLEGGGGGGGPEEMIYNVVANKEILKVSKQGFQRRLQIYLPSNKMPHLPESKVLQ